MLVGGVFGRSALITVLLAVLGAVLGVVIAFCDHHQLDKPGFGVHEAVEALVDSLLGGESGEVMALFREKVAFGPGARSAMVLGATGATGSKVLKELLTREGWGRVVVVGRRAPDAAIAEALGKEQPEFIAMDSLEDEEGMAGAAKKVKGVDVFFNCVGTTRSVAGSAQAFHDIEVGVTKKVAALAIAGEVKIASVVSAQGSAPDRSFAPQWFHPLFYGKVMGLKERAITEAGFQRVTIFRPGMLDRTDPNKVNDRTGEKFFASIFGGLKVSTLAAAMVNDAEAALPKDKEKSMVVSGNSMITQLSKI